MVLEKTLESPLANIFGTRDKVHGKQFFHGLGVVAVVVEQQPRSLACAVHSRVYIPMSI